MECNIGDICEQLPKIHESPKGPMKNLSSLLALNEHIVAEITKQPLYNRVKQSVINNNTPGPLDANSNC
jgi:hypothetical protein